MGTPPAVPLEPPKLDRMSLRTIPLCSSTSGPLEPSPGYGPAVSSGISPDAAADDDEADDAGPRFVKTKHFTTKPMTPEEAALQMDLVGHDFYFFANAETGLATVVYRRDDGHFGLIDGG